MKSIRNISKSLSLIISNPSIIFSNTRYLFILSHMRSRSTVLSHVLGSNAEICGYRELHLSYRGHVDLFKMRARIIREIQCDIKHKYLIDKILHNYMHISKNLLKSDKIKYIFLLREPHGTIKSIMNMGYLRGTWHKDPNKALQYYCDRLKCIEKYAEIVEGGYFFVESDDLVNNTEDTLDNLSNWLELKNKLCRNYKTFGLTGKPVYGDFSDNITTGTIKKTSSPITIEIPKEILDSGVVAYQNCKTKILKANINS